MLVSMPMHNGLLDSLPPADLDLLARHVKRASLDHGMVLQDQDQPVERICFPLSGAIALLRVVQDRGAVKVALVGREGAVGFGADFDPWLADTRAVVCAAGVAETIAAPLFRSIAEQSEHIRRMMLRSIEMLSVQICQTAACNALHSVEQRLAGFLLQVLDRAGSNTVLATQEVASQMLGVRRTTLTDVAGQLQQRGLIQCRRGQIRIVDRAALQEIACACPVSVHRLTELEMQKAHVNAVSDSVDPLLCSTP